LVDCSQRVDVVIAPEDILIEQSPLPQLFLIAVFEAFRQYARGNIAGIKEPDRFFGIFKFYKPCRLSLPGNRWA